MEHWPFVLPTGEQINPANPVGATYYHKDQTALVLRRLDVHRTRPSRVVTTFGDGYPIGTEAMVYHDQTRAFLGHYRVVGVHHFSDGAKVGEVPDRLIPHSVFK